MDKFFRPVKGRVVARYGTTAYLAAAMQFEAPTTAGGAAKALGYVQDLARVVRVTEAEYRRYRREYLQAVRLGDLTEASLADYNEWATSAGEPTIAGPVEVPTDDNPLDGGPNVEPQPKKPRRRKKAAR